MKLRLNWVLLLLLVALMVGWCASSAVAQDHAKPRDRERKPRAEEPKRHHEPPSTARERQPRPRQESEARPRDDNRDRNRDRQYEGRRDDNARDRDRDGYRRDDARTRHPRPRVDDRRDRNRDRRYEGRRDYDRYHWNRYRNHHQWNRDRFPRLYFGIRLFDHRFYLGRPFGPHYRMWYRDRYRVQRLFYWPFYYPPELGCDWYWVPRDRILVRDPYTGEEYWEYSDYAYVYICFD